MFVFVCIEKFSIFFQTINHQINNISCLFSSKETCVWKHNSLLVDWTNLWKSQCLSQIKVFCTTTWSNVNNTASFHIVNFVPSNNFVCKVFFWKFWETSFIFKPNKFCPLKLFQDFDVFFQNLQAVFSKNKFFSVKINFNIVKHWIDSKSDIRSKSPWGCCPCNHFEIFVLDWKFNENCSMFHFVIRRRHFVF